MERFWLGLRTPSHSSLKTRARVSHQAGVGLIADGSCQAAARVALFPAGKEKRRTQVPKDEEARNLHIPPLVQPPEQPLGEGTSGAPISVLVSGPPVL